MKKQQAMLLADFYKISHREQYPEGTELVYSNFTPRSNKYGPKGVDKLVSFGQQMIMKQIHEAFDKEFFSKPKGEVCGEMKRELSLYLGTDYDVSHFEALHDLGYLPIRVKGIEEGTLVPIKVPVLTIVNTLPEFYWVTNYLETIISNLLWKPMTSATIAHTYRKVLKGWQQKTDKEKSWFIDWQGHDFSMRGMDSVDATISSGLGHLTSFMGTDSLPAIYGARKYYGETEFVGGSVAATEHSVACAHMNIVDGKIDETSYITHLLKTYPTGILSMVSDTFNIWDICTVYLPRFKEEILGRDGKLVIRPDSGDPVDILCGEQVINRDYRDVVENGIWDLTHPKYNGVIELLWDVFGGTVNEQGYKVLDSHIGAIYGDSITIERADEICRRLEDKGFASTNVVLGIGSFTYQYNTRDTFGFAMKATYVEVNGEGKEIFKDPITDDGTKKSATGLLRVEELVGSHGKGIGLMDKVSWEEEKGGLLQVIYEDGVFHNQITLTEIRKKLM
jgi:nicotinamide phosphoribosyltransferase